ncbi:hypothetical protein BDV97DRAFT_389854 [Delphinella strobiligena]|nr:hypothetical protein BDV97DRAFT_389854 [Delphinella strobiligena]
MSLRSRHSESPAEEMELPPHPHMPRQDPNTGEWIYHERVSDGEVHRQFLKYRDLPQVRASREHRETEFADWERRHPPRSAREWLFSSYALVASCARAPVLSATGRPLRQAARATVSAYNNGSQGDEKAGAGRRSGRRATLSDGYVVGRSSRRITNVSNNAAAEAESDEAEPDDNSDEDDEDGAILTGFIPAEMLPPKEIFFKINEPRLLQIWVPSDERGGLGRLQAPFTVDFSSEDDIQSLNQWKDQTLNRARVRFGFQAEKRSQVEKRTRGAPYTAAERGWVVARLRQEPDMSWPDIKNVFFPAFQGKYPRKARTWNGFRALVLKINKRKRGSDIGADDRATSGEEKKALPRPRKIFEEGSDFKDEKENVDSGQYDPQEEGESRHEDSDEHGLQEQGESKIDTAAKDSDMEHPEAADGNDADDGDFE